MNSIPVRLDIAILCDGKPGTLPIVLPKSVTGDTVSIEVEGQGRKHVFQAADYFEALKLLRDAYEAEGVTVCCNGARIDVYPSGMSRDMGAARKAYEMMMGQQATRLVDIFGPCDCSKVGTVKEQEDFHTQWRLSIVAKRSG